MEAKACKKCGEVIPLSKPCVIKREEGKPDYEVLHFWCASEDPDYIAIFKD